MNEKKYQIFISSTYLDLVTERLSVQEAILRSNHIPLGMELFPASDSLWEVIENQIKESDYYLLIIGGRYGSLAKRKDYEGLSYTEIEYEFALKHQIPVLAFIRSNYKDDQHYKDSKPRIKRRLDRFVRRLSGSESERSKNFWSTPQDLSGQVIGALAHASKKDQRPGWIRANAPLSKPPLVFSKVKKVIGFTCFYYSFISHEIKKFTLEIKIGSNSEIVSVSETGFHEGENSKNLYSGGGSIRNGFAYLNLEFKIGDSIDLINIVLFCGRIDKLSGNSTKSFFGHLQGVSTVMPGQQYLTNVEFVAVRNKKDNRLALEDSQVLLLKQYLMISRTSYRIKSKNLNEESLENLEARKIKISSLKHLVGHYRVIIPIKPDRIIQSRLTIDQDLKCVYDASLGSGLPSQLRQQQVCLIRSSSFPGNNEKINLTMHEKNGVKVVSNIMIDLPGEDHIKEVLIGSYCNAGKQIIGNNTPTLKGKKSLNTNKRKIGTKAGFLLAIKYEDEDSSFEICNTTLESLRKDKADKKSITLYNLLIREKALLFPTSG